MCVRACFLPAWPACAFLQALLKPNQSALLSIRVTISKVAASDDITAAGSPAGAQREDSGKCLRVREGACVAEMRACVYVFEGRGGGGGVKKQRSSFVKCIFHAICKLSEQNESRFLPVFNLLPACVHVSVCQRTLRVQVRFPTSVVPISLCAQSGPWFYWSRQQEFHLSLIKPINGGV